MLKDLLWFLAFIVGLFFVWVYMGGPQKAREKNLSPTITQPVSVYGQNSKQSASTRTSIKNGDIRVTPF